MDLFFLIKSQKTRFCVKASVYKFGILKCTQVMNSDEKRYFDIYKKIGIYNYLPVEKSMIIIWTKMNSLLINIGPVVWEKKIFNFVSVFSLFYNHLPLKKGMALHLNKWIPDTGALSQVRLKLVWWFLKIGRKRKKINRRTDRRTTGNQRKVH